MGIHHNMLTWVIIILIALAAVLVYFTYPLLFLKEPFTIKDNCGLFLNLVSHTIKDEASCRSQCRAQCSTEDLEFSSSTFVNQEPACHDCECQCKKSLFG